MTDIQTVAAVVNLPKRHQQHSKKSADFTVSDILFFDASPATTKEEITELFQDFHPTDVHVERGSGFIRFSTKEKADCAYTLINQTHLKNGSRIRLGINCPGEPNELEPSTTVLLVENLPESVITDRLSLFNLFRPFGPMHLCKFDKQRDAALIQFFQKGDAEVAQRVTTYNIPQAHITVISADDIAETDDTGAAGQKNMVDYTNLYIKNLDHNSKSSDLFNAFRKYGRIISARVMKNPQTKQSKGFGFVSFSKADEAFNALQDMNGCYIMSKPIVVAFHEPKKPRNEKIDQLDPSQQMPMTPSLSPAIPTFMDPYFHRSHQPDIQTRPGMTSSPWQTPYHVPGFYGDPHVKPSYHDSASLASGFMPSSNMAPVAYGAYLQPPPAYGSPSHNPGRLTEYPQTPNNIDESNASREAATYAQRQRLRSAIVEQGESENIEDIVDMVTSLRRKDRSLCLFNPEFLRVKIDQAKNALASFDVLNSSKSTTPETRASSSSSVALSPTRTPNLVENSSKGTPSTISFSESKQHGCDEINNILESMKGLSTFQKKRKLGELLYPCVKTTGVRRSPAITIWLLDHIPLEDLVYSMYNEQRIKAKVDLAAAELL